MTAGSTQASPTVVIDLDGVVWLAGEPLAGGADAVATLRAEGFATLFVTNNSAPTVGTMLERLANVGIDAGPDELLTAAQAAAFAVAPGTATLVMGEEGLEEAASARGLTSGGTPAAVVVGWRRAFDFDLIAHAATAVRNGARFIATNDDPTHPTPNGLLPGTGALVAAIATAAETPAVIAGKPGEPMVELIAERTTSVCLVVGDRPSTDGALAARLSVPFGLVRSAATPASDLVPSHDGVSLLEVVSQFLAERS